MGKLTDLVKHSLNEWSLLNQPSDSLPSNKYKIYIYGNDRDFFTPHFHFFDNDKNFELEISLINIDNLKILSSIPRTGTPKSRLLTWFGLTKERKMLQKWLTEKNKELKIQTNKEAMPILWNLNNPDNEIDNHIIG